MNERIKELVEQTNALDYETFDVYNQKTVQHYKFNKEKFAQLIILECASLFPQTFTDEQYQRRIDKSIKKHFGIQG